MDNQGKPGGRVRVLEDADGDGRYEKSTLFADGLNFPTGLLTWKDGIFVTAAPDLLYLKDTDGDGRADRTEKVITGLTEGNQQLRANGLRWGLDNRIYCAAGGHHGGHGAATVLRSHRNQTDVKTGSRDFSFDPFTGDVRPESGPSQFGRNRDDAGHWFGTQNSRALWQYVLPDPYLKRNPHVPAPDPTQFIITPLNAPVYPVSPPEKRFHSFENTGHFTSACSGLIYRDDLLFPRREHELDAFTCEPFHNLVQHNILMEDGVSHTFRRAPGEEKHDFFASSDRWCRPVMTRTGPDGALWVVDMYRYIIEHPDWLPENGRAELLPYYRLGEDKGRLYRVVPEGKSPRKAARLDIMTIPQLAAALDSPNEWQRDKAHMMLVWKLRDISKEEKKQALAEVRAGLAHPNPLVRLHLLCALDGIGAGDAGAVLAGLEDPSPAVRENALRLAEPLPDSAVSIRLGTMVDDPDAKVRLQLAFSLGAWMPESHPDSAQAGITLAKLAVRDHADPWMRAAVMSSAAPHCRALCEGVAAAGGPALAAYADDLATLALALEDRDSLAAMVRPALTAPDVRFTPGQLSAFTRLLTALEKKGLTRAGLAEKPDALGTLMESSRTVFAFASRALLDASAATALRSAAAGLLLHDTATQSMAVNQLTAWLAPASDQTLQVAAVRHLAAFAGPAVPGILIQHLPGFSPETRPAALEALLSREAWSLELLDQMASNPGLALDAVQRARLLQHASEKVRTLAAKTLSAESSRQEVLTQFRPALSLKGDTPRGRQVFLNRCIACHRMEGAGIDLGPDLKSIAGHPAEKILTNIIDPSLDVQPGYFAYQARLGDGSVIYGLVTSETGNSVTFKLPDGTSRLVARQDLADLQSTGVSLMPPGLETGLSHQEMADLIAWLRSSPQLN
jgi:putative membrane-bound dehydrogenase-like protein